MVDYKTGNVRMTWHWGAFLQPLLQWKSNKYYLFWVYVCSLRYAACNALAPYCNLWHVPLYNIFPHLVNGMILGKKLSNAKCVFWFPIQRLSESFIILRRTERVMIKKNMCIGLRVKYPLFSLDFNETWIFSTVFFFPEYSDTKFYENPSNGSRVVPYGRTWRSIVVFHSFANASKNKQK
jgi:hypothetical protein